MRDPLASCAPQSSAEGEHGMAVIPEEQDLTSEPRETDRERERAPKKPFKARRDDYQDAKI